MARSWPRKDPNDVLDYSFDWSDRLDPGDSISSATISLATAAGLTINTQSYDTTTATVWLSGGTDGETAAVLCRIVTDDGRTMDWTASLAIVSQ